MAFAAYHAYPNLYIQVEARVSRRDSLSTSRSMPLVGTSRSQRLNSSRREQGNRSKSTDGIEYSPDNLALAAGEMHTERSAGNDSYMTSTQMAYMTGDKCWVSSGSWVQQRIRLFAASKLQYTTMHNYNSCYHSKTVPGTPQGARCSKV